MKGLLLVNTGNGKGKTTAAIGLAIRALGNGQRVAFIQFIKHAETGESMFLENYNLNNNNQLFYARMGLGCIYDKPNKDDFNAAQDAFALSKKLSHEEYDLLVLDEFCLAIHKGLVDLNEALDMIKNRRPQLSMVITGRHCPQEIIDLADTVTEMSLVKHAYQQGIQAKKGIEF